MSYPLTLPTQLPEDAKLWQDLKRVISSSSGFQSWRHEKKLTELKGENLDHLVRHYLRETLETLAY